jgi:alkanesulfonate monooxygenase SsuD/methylene tetrahydromethanopterin reductase-like flavin-dependent oxidoreductase (luciferase family)
MSGAPFTFSAWSDARPAPGDTDYARRLAELIDEAKLADQLGFHGFWTSEIHGVGDGYLGAQLPALAAIATVTSRVRLVTAVLVLPFYKPRQVVEASVIVDLLSQGRLELGVAVGAYQREFELFGVDMRRRGRLLEHGVAMLRHGLGEGQIPDGPDGAQVPVTPRPVQARVPILIGGLARPAIRRAVRLGDGTISYDFERPEENIPAYWEETLRPELEAGGRGLDDFRFHASLPLWVSDDPERDWHELYLPAFTYQQARYAEWYGAGEVDAGMPSTDEPASMQDHLVGTPEDIAQRLVATWRRAPWHDLGFFFRLPGIPHERGLEQLELVQKRLLPAISAAVAG